MGGLLGGGGGGGGGQRVCWPPYQIIGGPSPWPPSSYAYEVLTVIVQNIEHFSVSLQQWPKRCM